jgi:DNA-binding HxlR family transcriptional regulator
MMKDQTAIQHRPICPVSRTLDLLGDKWTLLIMRDALLFGCRTYAEFSDCSEKIPTNLLADRLKKLVAHGLLEKIPYQEKPLRYSSVPTKMGEEVRPILKSLWRYGETYLEGRVIR